VGPAGEFLIGGCDMGAREGDAGGIIQQWEVGTTRSHMPCDESTKRFHCVCVCVCVWLFCTTHGLCSPTRQVGTGRLLSETVAHATSVSCLGTSPQGGLFLTGCEMPSEEAVRAALARKAEGEVSAMHLYDVRDIRAPVTRCLSIYQDMSIYDIW
jgi:hypothetical protein